MATTTEESALERQVREEDEAHARKLADLANDDLDNSDAIADPPLEDTATGQTAIIDRSAYEREDLQIPKIDGQTVDRIALKFGGTVYLDRSDASDVAVYNELRFGRDVELLIDAKCLGVGASGATNKDGNLDVVVSTKGLKVHSISKPAGADWVKDAA
jgi:hypothetical protein